MTPRQLTQTAVALLAIVASFLAQPVAAQPKPNPEHAEMRRTALNVSALRPGDKAMLAVELEIKPKYHAQSRTPNDENLIKFDVKIDPHPALTFGEPVFPKGEDHDYPDLGKLNVYTGTVVVRVPFEVKPDAKAGEAKITGRLTYQICDDRVCYPPASPKFEIKSAFEPAGAEVKPNEPDLFKDAEKEPNGEVVPPAPEAVSTTAPTTGPAAAPATSPPAPAPAAGAAVSFGGLEGSEWSAGFAFYAAFIAGLLFNIMPCVLPVLPIKAMGFYEAARHSRARSMMLGAVFGLGIISVFGVLALFVLVLRVVTWGELFSQGWFVWSMVIVLVAFAFSLFGAFTFRLPVGTYNFQPSHDSVSGNFLLGGLTAILATPCTAPLLPPLLVWMSSQPTSIGVPAMLMVGVGMAFPYLILSAVPELAKRFPRTGPWSELFKQMMGFMMLVAAAYFAAGRLVHGTGFWWIVTAVVAVAALFLVARTVQLTKDAAPVAVSSALAIVMLGGALWWTANVTGLTARPAVGAVAALPGGRASFEPYSRERFDALRREGKPVLVKFTANWCATCQVIEGTVFADPDVWTSIGRHDVVPLKVDLTDSDAPGRDLLLELNPAGGIPLTAIFSPALERPIVLGSLYTSGTLLSALDQAVPETQVAGK